MEDAPILTILRHHSQGQSVTRVSTWEAEEDDLSPEFQDQPRKYGETLSQNK